MTLKEQYNKSYNTAVKTNDPVQGLAASLLARQYINELEKKNAEIFKATASLLQAISGKNFTEEQIQSIEKAIETLERNQT